MSFDHVTPNRDLGLYALAVILFVSLVKTPILANVSGKLYTWVNQEKDKNIQIFTSRTTN